MFKVLYDSNKSPDDNKTIEVSEVNDNGVVDVNEITVVI